MREIKFRCWDKGKKEFLEHKKNGKIWFSYPEMLAYSITNPDKYELMQWSGLTDRNGKDVYESDRVKALYQHDGHINRDYWIEGVIEWSDEHHQWVIAYLNKDDDNEEYTIPMHDFEREEFFPEELEVLGNIYKNSLERK